MAQDPHEVIEPITRLGKLFEWIVSLARAEFYGTIEIRFEKGFVQPNGVRKIESVRIDEGAAQKPK